jgi:hypothetical protein
MFTVDFWRFLNWSNYKYITIHSSWLQGKCVIFKHQDSKIILFEFHMTHHGLQHLISHTTHHGIEHLIDHVNNLNKFPSIFIIEIYNMYVYVFRLWKKCYALHFKWSLLPIQNIHISTIGIPIPQSFFLTNQIYKMFKSWIPFFLYKLE